VTKMPLECRGDSTAGAVFVFFQFICMMMLLPCVTQCIRTSDHGQHGQTVQQNGGAETSCLTDAELIRKSIVEVLGSFFSKFA